MPVKFQYSPEFEVHREVFEVPLLRNVKIPTIDRSLARERLRKLAVSNRIGCYIFALRSKGGPVAWYVGKTANSFRNEVFTDRNCGIYTESMNQAGGGKPIVTFVVLPKARGRTHRRAVDKLEELLISDCGSRNPQIKNSRRRTFYITKIRGVMNSGQGRPSRSAQVVKQVMGR